MKKFIVGITLIMAMIFASAGGAGKQPKASDYTPEQLSEMAAAQGEPTPDHLTGVPVSPGQAKKAIAALRGKGLAVEEEGMLDSPFRTEAAGATALAGDSYSTLSDTANRCWSRTDLHHSQGIWPTNQGVTEYRYWCAHGFGGAQYYRASAVDSHSAVCRTLSKNQFLINGGNGYRYAVVRSEAWFNCVPGINLATRQNWSCNTWGNCEKTWNNDWAWWE